MQSIIIEPLITLDSKIMEEIKKLRTNINFLNVKVINITSVTSGEGKSTISFWIAKTLSEIDKKVILIDANIRKNDNSVYKTINVSVNNKGLTDLLINNISNEDIICSSNYKNLDFILPGKIANNAPEILNNVKIKKLIDFLKNHYDYIIIDTPAAGEVTDASIIASYSDGNVLIIESGIVDYELAIKVKEQLENSGTKLLGVVINKV